MISSLLYSFFLSQTDALKHYAPVRSSISLTWQPKGVLTNESFVPTVNVSLWWCSLISLRNRAQYQPHCIFHKMLSDRMHCSIYFYTEWISDEAKQIPEAYCYCNAWEKWFFLPSNIKSQTIKPIINITHMFSYTSVARVVLLYNFALTLSILCIHKLICPSSSKENKRIFIFGVIAVCLLWFGSKKWFQA